MTTPNHPQRQFMQRLRNAGWVKATALPDSPKMIARLIGHGWIEARQTEDGLAYRLTDAGLQAKMAPITTK